MPSNYITGTVPAATYNPWQSYIGSPVNTSASVARQPMPDISWTGNWANIAGFNGRDPNPIMSDPDYKSGLLDELLNPIISKFLDPEMNMTERDSGDDDSSDEPVDDESTAEKTYNTTNSVPQSVIDYLNADLAKHYGMSKETAYQEALSNTSYQRAVKDMQAAGLNPAAIFGAGRGSGSSGVSYVSSASPAGSGGAGRTTAKKENLFSKGAYYGISAGIGLLAGILTKSPTGYWIGSQASQGFMTAANSYWQNSRK